MTKRDDRGDDFRGYNLGGGPPADPDEALVGEGINLLYRLEHAARRLGQAYTAEKIRAVRIVAENPIIETETTDR